MKFTLENWLKKHPRPNRIIVVDTSGVQHEIKRHTNQTWAGVCETIRALDPDKIQAYSNDTLTRATEFESLAETEDEEEAEEDTDAVTTPVDFVHPPKNAGADSQVLIVFGNLIARAYQHANETAFGKMVDVFDLSNQRWASLERTMDLLQKQLRDAQDEIAARDEELLEARTALVQQQVESSKEDGGLGGLLTAAASGFLGASTPTTPTPPATPPTNGKAS